MVRGGREKTEGDKIKTNCHYYNYINNNNKKSEEWDMAQTDFFESFKNYDEAGSPQRIQVLK